MSRKKVSKSKSSKRRFHLHTVLFFVGLLCLIIPLVYYVHEVAQLSFTASPPQIASVDTRHTIPTYIAIPDKNIYRTVTQTSIHNGIWEIAKDSVSHLISSSNPGADGNIIMYAHNTQDYFGNIRSLVPGEKINVTTRDGKVHTYVVKTTRTVSASDIHTLTEATGETLTLYTCTGLADIKRFIVKAVPEMNLATPLQ